MSQWALLETFVQVIEGGSFSAAAARLGVSKSLVSKRITALERHLGTQLLHRTTRHMNPTEAGNALYEKCGRLLSSLEEAQDSVRHMEEVPRGHLRIAAADWFSERYLSACSADFNMRYPQLRVDLHISSRRIDLVAERYDLALHYGALNDSSLRARKICEIPHVVCGAPSYIRRRGRPQSIDDLRSHNCLVSDFELCTTWRFREAGVLRDINLDGTWRSNNGQALLSAALQGLGLCRLPLIYVHQYLNDGRLESLLDDYREDPILVWLLYPNTRYVPAKVRLFIDYFCEWIAGVLSDPEYAVHDTPPPAQPRRSAAG